MSLRIKTVHLENFKSWFGRHSIELDSNKFMAIVGANGSGKSNIIDALLFVFGWRAKQLRQAKLVDLIHYSEEQPDYAKVEIDFINLDFQFSISRVVKKSGLSHYEINNEKSTLEAVTEILLDNGLDINHNRFLILEGEVESISMMKPSGDDVLTQMVNEELLNLEIMRDVCDELKLEFDPNNFDSLLIYLKENVEEFEPAIQQLVNKIVSIEDSENNLESSETGLLEFIEQIIGTEDHIPEIAKESALTQFIFEVKNETRTELNELIQYRDELNNSKDEAVATIKNTTQQVINNLNTTMFENSNSRFIIEEKNLENIELEQEIDQISSNNDNEENNIEQIEESLVELTSEKSEMEVHLKNVDSQLDINKEQFKQNELNSKLEQDEIKEYNKDITNSGENIDKSNNELEELDQEYNNLPNEQEKLESQQIDLKNEIETKEEELSQQQNENQANNEEILSQKQSIEQIENKINPISENKAEMESKLEISRKSAQGRLNELVEQIGELASSMLFINQEYDYNNPKLEKLMAHKEEINQQLGKYNQEKLEQSKIKLQEELVTTENELEAIDLKLNEISNQKVNETKNSKLLQELMLEVKNNLMTGIHGRLGSLGEINPQLNLAAIAAFGGELDYIVCDNMKVIQNCLQFIRDKNLGYASFIDLEQVTKRYQESRSYLDHEFTESEGGAEFLNLVKTDAMLMPAFWHVMEDTVICDTSNEAILINKNKGEKWKIRVVTKDGEVYEKGGSLTGGGIGNLVQRFVGFSKSEDTNADPSEITNLEKEKEGLSLTVDNIETQTENIEKQLKDIEHLKNEVEELTEEINAEEYEIEEVSEKILLEINKIKEINDNTTIEICTGEINKVLYDELLALEETLNKSYNTNIIELLEKCKEITPNLIEIVEYYVSEKYNSKDVIFKYLKSQDPIFILEGDSDFSNLIEFESQLVQLLQLQNSEEIKEQIHVLEVQEENYETEIEGLNNEINKFSNIEQYQQLRKEITSINNQLANIVKQQEQLEVLEKRYQPSRERILNTINELEEQLQNYEEEKMECENVQEQIESQEAQFENVITEETEQINNYNQQLLIFNQEINTKEELLNELNEEIIKLENIIHSNVKNIEELQEVIAEYELLFTNYIQVLEILGEELAKADEQIEYQIPLYGNHENIEELNAFDEYILTNFSEYAGENKKDKKSQELFNIQSDNITSEFINEFRVLTDYEERVEEMMEQEEIFSEIEKDYDDEMHILNDLKDARQELFLASYNEINSRLREIYRVFSMGGDATLEFVDSFDPFQGLNYSVMPPKKAWRSIENLSGGEKTLSSLSLIFALHEYKKNFIYVVDEIDAALDFRNVSLVANYLKEQAKECEFVIISLRNNTFEVADKLIGVYKVNNTSRTVSLDITSDQ